MTRPNVPANSRRPRGRASQASAAVSILLERRDAKYHVSNVVKPILTKEETEFKAIKDAPEDTERGYLAKRFKGANEQLAEEARSELVSAEERLGWSAEEAVENNRSRSQRASYEVVRKPGRVEQQTDMERAFVWIVLGAGGISLTVAWTMVTANMFNSGLFPALMEFPHSLSLLLMSFAAVALSLLPKVHVEQLTDERERKAFVRKLEIVTAATGLVWLICISVIFSPTADMGATSLDLDLDAEEGGGLIGSVLLLSQLATEVGMGALLWIFGLRLTEKGRLEVAHASPAYATFGEAGDRIFIERKELEAHCGALRGFLSAMEEVKEAFITEELERIAVERFRQQTLRQLAVVRALEADSAGADQELRAAS